MFTRNLFKLTGRLSYNTVRHSTTSALNVFERSCYHNIDFKINEESSVKEAVERFTAFNIGCLAVVDKNSKLVGVCSERDYIKKIASLGKNDLGMKVKEIATAGPSIIVAKTNSTIDSCMQKMMFKNIKHLIILDDNDANFIGMISIRDLIKEIMKKDKEIITRLSDFNIGKGAFFGSE